MSKKQNTTKSNKTAGQAAAELEAKKLADARATLDAEEKRKKEEATVKFNVLIKAFENETGYSIAPFTACLGNKILESGIHLVKLQK